MKIFWTAHEAMRGAGFESLKSFAVRGWMAPLGAEEIAKAVGYTEDLTLIDPSLVSKKLKEFPISRWITVPAFHAVAQDLPRAWVQKGGVLEFNRVEDIVQRLQDFAGQAQDKRALFGISLSQENSFMNKVRLSSTIRNMQKFAAKSGLDLNFQTASGTKNSRPLMQKVRLSRNP
jgi:cell division inhibitor SulA